MNMKAFVGEMEKAIEGTPPDTLRSETRFRELPQWDSLAGLNILAMISLEYDVELDVTALRNCQTVEDVFHAVQAHKGT